MEDLEAQDLVRQLFNPLEILTNLIYLVQSDPGNERNVIGYINMAEAEVDRLAKLARCLSFETPQPLPLEFIHSERLDGDMLIVDFSDGTQGRYTPDELAGIGRRRWRSDEGSLGQ